MKDIYNVKVFDKNGECIDAREFEFGTWAEIGFWLDHYGYNDSRYKLEIRFG